MRVHKLREGEWIIAKNFRSLTTEPAGAGLESRDCDAVPIFDSWCERFGFQDQVSFATVFKTADEAARVMATIKE